MKAPRRFQPHLLLAAILSAGTAAAVDVLPLPRVVVQPDGTTLELLPHGDEFNVFWELPTGHTVVRDGDGWWRVAGLDADGRLVARGERGKALEVGALRTVAPHLRPRRLGGGAGELRPVPPGSRALTPRVLAAAGEQQPLLVILVQFANRAPVGATAAQFAGQFFTGDRSVSAYFDANLFGRLDVAPAVESHGVPGDGVVGWLPLAMNHPNRGIASPTGGNQELKNQAQHDTRLAIKAAIEAAAPYVDFAAYDRDGNGALATSELAVTVIFAGYESSYGGYTATYSPANWGHRWSLGFSDAIGYVGPAVVDGVTVCDSGSAGGYTSFGEWMQSSASNGHRATLGIMVHELGHDILSLPDLYDPDGGSAGLGGWCLMASGSWGAQGSAEWSGDTPTGLSAWSKLVTGALKPVELTGSGTAAASPSAAAPAAFRFGSGVANEYFLLEYRAPIGFDTGLQVWDSTFSAGGGLLLLHVDERVDGNGDENHKRVDVEEANLPFYGYSLLDLNVRDAARTTLFYAGNNARFADDTNPDAHRYDGTASGVVVSEVGAAEAAAIQFSYVAPNPSGYAADSCASALPVTLAPGVTRPIVEDPTQAATSPLPRLCTPVSGLAWYRVEPARSGLLTVETTGYDTVAAVLRGACDALEVAACNDDGVAAGGGSLIKDLPVTRGESVYVVIGRWATSITGTLSGAISLAPGAPLQMTPVEAEGCPRAVVTVDVSSSAGPVTGLTRSDFTLTVDGTVVEPSVFADAGNRYTLVFWLEGGGGDTHAVRVEVDGEGTAGELEMQLSEAGTSCTGIAEPTETLVIPMAAHLAGSQGTNWRTDVFASLTGAAVSPVDVEVAYLEHAAANPSPSRVVFVEEPGGRSLPDIAASSFDVTAGKGALLLRWQRGNLDASRLRVASRTYNLLSEGNALGLPAGASFGQEVPGIPLDDALAPGGTAWITGLVQRTGVARSNVGLLAAGPEGATVELDFFGADGAALLSRSVTLRAWEYLQIDKILQPVAGGVDAASMRIAPAVGAAPLVAYASVVDDLTGDPVTLLPAAASGAWFVPMAANLTGVADTNWRSDLTLANPGNVPATVTVIFLQEGRDNAAATAAAPIVLPPNGCTRIGDIVSTLFGRGGVKGALRVVSDQPVVVASRTYNLLLAGNSLGLPAGATFGQGVPGVTQAEALDTAHPGAIPGVVRNDAFRSNLGLLDVSGLGAVVTIAFRDAVNAPLGAPFTRTLRAFEYLQVNNVLASAGVSGDVADATVELSVAGAGAAVAYLSVIDARTGDPVTIMAER